MRRRKVYLPKGVRVTRLLELKHDVACYARDGTAQTKNGVIVCDRVDNIAAELRVRARRACG